MTIENKTTSDAEYRNAMQQLAVEFENLESEYGANPKNKCVVHNNLCRRNGDIIYKAFVASNLANSSLENLVRRRRNTQFLLHDLIEALIEIYPERFLGISPDPSKRAATALTVLADGLAGPEQRARAHRRGRYVKLELTQRQVEAHEMLGIHQTKTAAARAMGVSRATFDKHFRAGSQKLGKLATGKKPRTEQLPTDRRGQPNMSFHRRND